MEHRPTPSSANLTECIFNFVCAIFIILYIVSLQIFFEQTGNKRKIILKDCNVNLTTHYLSLFILQGFS